MAKKDSESVRKKKEKKPQKSANNNNPTELSMRRKKKKNEKSVDPSERSQRHRRRQKSADPAAGAHKAASSGDVNFAFHFKECIHPTEPGQSTTQRLVYDQFIRYIVGTGVEGLVKEYNTEVRPFVAAAVKRASFDDHPNKNRYKDVVCNEFTRVILNDGREGDYIHANYVRGLQPTFILTQGPMASTVIDFWRMVIQEKVSAICMLCDLMECGKRKCERYYPETVGQKVTFGEFTITCDGVNMTDQHACVLDLDVEVGGVRTSLRHSRLKTWPDKTVPKSSMSVLRQLLLLRRSPSAVVVHCSAGIGRTGTLVAIELCIQTLLNSRPLNMADVCKQLRTCRLSCVQVDVQYLAVAVAVGECGRSFKYVDDVNLLASFAAFKEKVDAYVIEHPPPDSMMPPSDKLGVYVEGASRASRPAVAPLPPPPPPSPPAPQPSSNPPLTSPSPTPTPTNGSYP